MRRAPIHRSQGMSLIECVLSMAAVSIMLAAMADLTPLLIATSQSRAQAQLAEKAEAISFLLARDMDAAYPDSARVANVGRMVVLEMAPIHAIGRHRAGSPAAEPASPCAADDSSLVDPDHPEEDPWANDRLSIGVADSCFATVGPLDASRVQASDWVALPGFGAAGFYGAGAASGGAKARLAGVQSDGAGARVQMEPTSFAADSPGSLFAIVGQPRTWVCDPVAGILSAFEGYAPSAAQPSAFGGAPLATITGITSCSAMVDAPMVRMGFALSSGGAAVLGGASATMGRGSW